MKFVSYAQTAHPATKGLKFKLHKHLRYEEPPRSIKILHASALTGTPEFCPREYALLDETHKKKNGKWIGASERATYGIGHYMQDQVIQWLAEEGSAITNWRCLACNRLHEHCKKPAKCSECYCKEFKPEEIRFISEVSGASGGFDMICDLGEPELRLVEIKTIDKEEFKKLLAPLAEHRIRTNLYLRIAAESDHPMRSKLNLEVANILYVSKGGYGCADANLIQWKLWDKFSPFKEWVIDRNDNATDPYVQKALAIKSYRDGYGGMPNPICPTSMCPRASKCSVVKECWSGDFPAGKPKEGPTNDVLGKE